MTKPLTSTTALRNSAATPEDDEGKPKRASASSGNRQQLIEQYRSTLADYLDSEDEGPLLDAYELGRSALAYNLGLLDLSILHREALNEIFEKQQSELVDHKLLEMNKAAGLFFDEVLSPYELSRLSNTDIKAILPRVYSAREEESRRIAHILHDEAAQMLALAFLELNDLIKAPDTRKGTADRLMKIMEYLEQVREQLRTLSHDLRPMILDQLGLLPALEQLANGYRKNSGLTIDIVTENLTERVNRDVETGMFRVVQEALVNIAKHAQAEHVEIKLRLDNSRLHARISDDGVGFDGNPEAFRENQGIGLHGMKERINSLQGIFSLRSEKGKGTVIDVEIPL